MAKKTVASFNADKGSAKKLTKCIRMVKSPKNGAYAFKEEMVLNTEVASFFKK